MWDYNNFLKEEVKEEKKEINREFNFFGDIYEVVSLTPLCVELKDSNEKIIKIFSNNSFFKILIREMTGRGILATDI
ncbi:hypothetical protein ACFLZ0_02960 [Patescibacteria group bacterium]